MSSAMMMMMDGKVASRGSRAVPRKLCAFWQARRRMVDVECIQTQVLRLGFLQGARHEPIPDNGGAIDHWAIKAKGEVYRGSQVWAFLYPHCFVLYILHFLLMIICRPVT